MTPRRENILGVATNSLFLTFNLCKCFNDIAHHHHLKGIFQDTLIDSTHQRGNRWECFKDIPHRERNVTAKFELLNTTDS